MASYTLRTYILHTMVFLNGELIAILPPVNDPDGWDKWTAIATEMFTSE